MVQFANAMLQGLSFQLQVKILNKDHLRIYLKPYKVKALVFKLLLGRGNQEKALQFESGELQHSMTMELHLFM